MRRAALGALVLASALLAGCAAPPAPVESDGAVVDAVKRAKAARAEPLGLALMPVTATYSYLSPAGETSWRPVALDAATVTAAIARDLGLAFDVSSLRTEAAEPGPATFEAAAAQGADVLARVTFRRFDDEYRGRFWWTYIPNLAIWIYAWVPSWFVPDMTFGARADATLELWGVASERPLLDRPVEIHADAEQVMSSIERGWSIFGILLFPWTLDQDNWRDVGEALEPHALREVRVRTLVHAVDAAYGAGAEGFEARDATTFALVAGVSTYRRAAPSGAADAREVADLLAAMGVPAKNVTVLRDERATVAALERALEDLAGRARPCDSVLVYFSGCGTSLAAASRVEGGRARAADDLEAPGAPALAAAAFDPARPEEGALPLDRLRGLVARIPARRVVVALDASFSAGPRSIPGGGGPVPDEAFASLVRGGPPGRDIALLVAADGRGEAGDHAGAGHGHFTAALCGTAEAAGRGIDVEALFEGARREMVLRAGVGGLEVSPRVWRATRASGGWLDPRPSLGNSKKGS